MNRPHLVGLGIRLATAGGRAAWMRLGLMAAGFAVGAALLLAATSIVPALGARDARENAQYGTQAGRNADDALRTWYLPQAVGDLEVEVQVAEAVGDAPAPPGLARPPAPGEIFASAALAARWSGPVGAGLERRLGGRFAGTIGPDGVAGPDELSVWVGRPPGAALPPRDGYAYRSFDPPAVTADPLDLTALITLVAIASAVLLPIWLFVGTATRLSAATREARLAAVRLAGGTEAQVRMLAGVEAGVAAAVGTAAGIPLFLLLRPLLADGLIVGLHFYPGDLSPPPAIAVAILLALPALAVAMSLATMRRLVVSPLGVARRVRRSHAGWRWTLVLASGCALLAWSATRHEALMERGGLEAGLLVGSGLALAAFGLTGTATWTAWLLARRFAERARSSSVLLGMRRLEAEPSSVGRVVGGVALMIALAGVVQSGLGAAEGEDGQSYLAEWTKEVEPDTVVVFAHHPSNRRELSVVGEVAGVESFELTEQTPYGGRRTRPTTAIVRTDRRPETVEALRDRTVWFAEAMPVSQLRARDARNGEEYERLRSGIMLVTLFLLLVNGATLLVAMVDWVMERRRTLAVLSAVGVQAGVVRGSVLAQVALPLATAVAFGFAGALAVVALLYTAVETAVVLPIRQLVALSAATVVVVAGVTALSMPWVRATRRPELLRNG